MSLEAFREETRAWLEENCPESMRTPMRPEEMAGGGRKAVYRNPDTKVWMERCAERGFTAPTWPEEYGGAGLNADEFRVFREEVARIHARTPLAGMGLTMIGPALLEYGNDEQKAEHLPKITRGEIRWCQGYSEPNAGSDLAGLQTKAIVDGDDYIINGQKIWTSGADGADWIFCLVRTDFEVQKQQGITFILFDMESPGVTVRPIKLISGASQFCETFFEDVRVPRKNVVGNVNDGWTVAKRLLQYERTSIGGGGGGPGAGGANQKTLAQVAIDCIGKDDGGLADRTLRHEIASQLMDDRAFGLTVRRSQEESRSIKAPSFASSMFKYYGTEQNKKRQELLLKARGTQMLGWEGEGFTAEELTGCRGWLRSKGNSIEGGTSEVQLNIIAKRVLGLPD